MYFSGYKYNGTQVYDTHVSGLVIGDNESSVCIFVIDIATEYKSSAYSCHRYPCISHPTGVFPLLVSVS